MYARTSLGMQNMQNWGKGCVFGHVYKYCSERDKQIMKEHQNIHD